MKQWFYVLLALAYPAVSTAQVVPPALGAASSFALFTAVGAFDNVGPSIVFGDIGTNAGAFSGFPLGVVNGSIHVGDSFSTQAATDVQTAFGQMSSIPCVVPLGVLGGVGGIPQVLTPNAYCLGGATTFAGELVLDAQGNPNAVFFIRVSGALTTGAGSVVTLINGASRDNVYWQVTGRVDMGNNSLMQGTLVVDGAINLIEGARLMGRGLSREGAITMDTNLVNVPLLTSTTWLGSSVGTLAARRNWFLSSNWSNGIPSATTDASILSGRPSYPVITVGTPTTLDLTLGSMASLTQNTGTLEIHGDFSNSGTFTANGGTVALAGLTSQSIGGSSITRYWNLAIGLADATLTGETQIKRVLTLTGDLTTNGNTLFLLSDNTATAMVVNAGGEVTGTATVQRYINAGTASGLGYRHLSAPVSGSTVADLATPGFTPLVNTAYNEIPTPRFPTALFPNVYAYDEQRGGAGSSDFMLGYFCPPSSASLLEVGHGYTVYMKPLKLDFVGTLTNGDVSRLGLTRTGSFMGDGEKSGWHLMGNPYPSPLDWDLVTVPMGMSPSISVYKSTGGGTGIYLTRSGGMGNLPNGEIAMAQAFFARVVDAGPVDFTIPNNARVTSYSNPMHFRPVADTRPQVSITLRAAGAPAEQTDETFVYFQAGATAGVDTQHDGQKPARNVGVATLVSLTRDGQELAINGLPESMLSAGTTVALLLDLPTAGAYELATGQLLNLTSANVALVDRLTGTRYELATQPVVSFTAQAGELRDRFTLEIGQRVTGQAELMTAAGFEVYPNPLKSTDRLTIVLTGVATGKMIPAVLYNQLGQAVWTTTLRSDQGGVRQEVPTQLARGIYSLQLTLPAGTKQSRRVVVN